MTKASISLQDLRRRLYSKAKTEPTWRFWGLHVHVCKQVAAHDAAKSHQNEGFVSERRGGVETALCGAEECAQAVGGDPGLEGLVEPFHATLG